MQTDRSYVEERAGTWYVLGQRVPLHLIIADWRNGASPETIAEHFPVLTLAEVYGSIAFYLGQPSELDVHFAEIDREEFAIVAQAKAARSERARLLHERFAASRALKESTAS